MPCRRVLTTWLLAMALGLIVVAPQGHAAQSVPQLAASYALPSKGLVLGLVGDGSGDDASSPAPSPETVSAPVAVSDERTEQLRLQYERGARLHRTGVILAIGGAIVIPSSGLILIGAAFGGNEPVAIVAAATFIGSGIVYIAGGVMASVGSITATRAVNEVLGIDLPVGVAWAGVVLSTVGLLATPVGGLGLAGPLLGAVCGAIQMSQANRALQSAGLASIHVIPTTRGIQLVGRF